MSRLEGNTRDPLLRKDSMSEEQNIIEKHLKRRDIREHRLTRLFETFIFQLRKRIPIKKEDEAKTKD